LLLWAHLKRPARRTEAVVAPLVKNPASALRVRGPSAGESEWLSADDFLRLEAPEQTQTNPLSLILMDQEDKPKDEKQTHRGQPSCYQRHGTIWATILEKSGWR
jgi:hypothetical protein